MVTCLISCYILLLAFHDTSIQICFQSFVGRASIMIDPRNLSPSRSASSWKSARPFLIPFFTAFLSFLDGMLNLAFTNQMEKPKQDQFMTLDEVKQKWQHLTNIYSNFDPSMHLFYYQLISMLRLGSATCIYEVGCGRGLLIPYAMTLKSTDTPYLAIDICKAMVGLARQNIRKHLSTMPVDIDEQAYYAKNHLSIECCDGQRVVQPAGPFDRIICNLVLMITPDPEEMMLSFYKQAKEGCLLGVTVTGDVETQNFMLQLPSKIRKRLGIETEQPKTSKNHVLWDKLEELGHKTGWELVASRDSKAAYKFFELDQTFKDILVRWEAFSKGILEELFAQISYIFAKKEVMVFPAKIAIFRRK